MVMIMSNKISLERLKATLRDMEHSRQNIQHNTVQLEDSCVHIMPDGTPCILDNPVKYTVKKEPKKGSKAEVFKNAFIFSELISAPVCKKKI